MTLRRARVDRTDFPSGMVWLVGAGPGDPELLTRKAERLIREATAIYYDALVGPGVLELAPASARLVHVGKRSGRHSKDQKTIDRLIVEAALTGERVVRLKGGDPSIFGRATEELEACRTAGVPVAVCPGVTAASAAAAGLGRSLTLRGLARKLVLVTAPPAKASHLMLTGTASPIPKRHWRSTWARARRGKFPPSFARAACGMQPRRSWSRMPACRMNCISRPDLIFFRLPHGRWAKVRRSSL